MKKGYILALSLKILLIVSSVFLIRYNQVATAVKVYKEADFIYARLRSEKYILNEVLERFYNYEYDDFDDFFEEYDFNVKMNDVNIQINISYLEQYTINVTYDEECLCFTEILYK